MKTSFHEIYKKKNVNKFLQNETKQILNLHNKDEHQTLVDERIITILEREIEFLKTEIFTKNGIFNKILNNT